MRPSSSSFLVGLALVSTACGDDGVHHLADAPPAHEDGGADASPDAPPAPVTLTITNAGGPVAGAKVYFQGPDSSEILSTTTDATGTATAVMPHGGFVTAVDPIPQPPPPPTAIDPGFTHDLKTFANVKPGDHLVIHDSEILRNPPTMVFDITYPLDPANPSYYDIYTDCGSGNAGAAGNTGSGTAKRATVNGATVATGTTSITLYGCAAATANFTIVTLDGTNSLPLDYAVIPNVAVADGTPVDLSAATYAGTTSAEFDFTNAGAGIIEADEFIEYVGAGGIVDTGRDDTYFYAPITAGAGSATTALPVIPNTTMVEHVDLSINAANSAGAQQLYRWGATPDGAGKYTLDFTVNQPLLDFMTSPAFDQPTRTLSWMTNPGATPDFYYASIHTYRATPDGSGGSVFVGDWNWEVAGAFAGAAIQLPALPGDAADYNPTTDDAITANQVLLAKMPIAFDVVRPRVFDLADFYNYGPTDLGAFVVGPSGHFEVEEWSGASRIGKRSALHDRRFVRRLTPMAALHAAQETIARAMIEHPMR